MEIPTTTTARSSAPALAPAPLLPGQAAAPAGPCDLTGMYLMHHAFRRDLRDLAAAAVATPTDDTAWAALRHRWERFAHLLHHHHEVEDRVLWPLLVERATDADDRAGLAVLEAMEAEHALIDPVLERAGELFADRAPDGAALHAVLADAAEVLGDHLAHEESGAVPLVQRYVTAAEWEELERREFRGRPSLGELRFQLPWMVEGLSDEVVRPLLRAAGPVFALVLALSRRSFARHQRAAFAHLPSRPGPVA
jgi:hemerythrin-like domain-containing protein